MGAPSSDYTLAYVQRDGVMHDGTHFGEDLAAAVSTLEALRATSDPLSIHWCVYDREDPERGYFDSVEVA
jgi:hypothetical protein